MMGLGTQELIIILGIAFLFFGGKKLPEIGTGLGKAITSFKKGMRDAESSGKEPEDDKKAIEAKPAASDSKEQ